MRGFEIVKNSELVKFSINESDIIFPKRSTIKSAGYDFYSPIEISIKSGESKVIPTGVKASMEDNEFLGIYIRSSLAIKYSIKLKNQVGIIDSDYYSNESNDGHILICLENQSKEDFIIKKGDKVAQGIFQSYFFIDNDSCNTLRTGGIGSTGK